MNSPRNQELEGAATLTAIRENAPGSYCVHVNIRFGEHDESHAFHVTAETEPFFRIAGPHSLWRLLEPVPDSPKKLASLISSYVKDKALPLPVTLGTIKKGVALERPAHSAIWRSQGGASYPVRVSRAECKWTISHLHRECGNTLFPSPFEHAAISYSAASFIPLITKIDTLRHRCHDARKVVAPKSTVGTRTGTQLSPLDAIILTSLALMAGEKVEKSRVNDDHSVVHSFRFAPNEHRLWSTKTGWHTFVKAAIAHATNSACEYVVCADVASFYHRIKLSLLEIQLEKIGVQRRLASSVCNILRGLAGGDLGLPVGPSFSALFAEAMLTHIDEELLSRRVEYVRFNDDFRFFCASPSQCNSVLSVLSDVLGQLGLAVQRSKTRIIKSSEFIDEQKSFDRWWLRRLHERLVEDESHGAELSAEDSQKVKSASSVLRSIVHSQKGEMWPKLARAAFNALTPVAQAEVIPEIVGLLNVLEPLSSDVALSLRSHYIQDNTDGSITVNNYIRAAQLQAEGNSALRDYSSIWMMDALSRVEWDAGPFAKLHDQISPDAVFYRELVLASRVAPKLQLSQCRTEWTARAIGHVSGQPVDATRDHSIYNQAPERLEFERELARAIVAAAMQPRIPTVEELE